MKKFRTVLALICVSTILCGCSGNVSVSAPESGIIDNLFLSSKIVTVSPKIKPSVSAKE